MIRHIRANAIAYLALFVALGGTSYAITALPKNSVGTRQLKARSVTKAKLASGVAIRGGAGPTGPIGPIGPAGQKGDAGLQGAKGDAGSDGAVGPTEGGAIGGAIPASSDSGDLDVTNFATTRPGKLWVAKQTSFVINCSPGQAQVWLTLDGHAVPGSLLDNIPSGFQEAGVTLSGTTAGPVAAGSHTVGIRSNCPSGSIGGGFNVNNELDWIVLGT